MPASGKRPTTWEYIEAFPPPYCRCFGKREGSGRADMAITDAELAIGANIPIDRVREISRMTTWQGVPFDEMQRFFVGCKFDPTNSVHRHRITEYQKICKKRKVVPFQYLRLSPKWETEFLPLLVMVQKIMRSKIESSKPATGELLTASAS